jgi:hypothetical protein
MQLSFTCHLVFALTMSLALASFSFAQVVEIDEVIQAVKRGKEPECAKELKRRYFAMLRDVVRDEKINSPQKMAAFFFACAAFELTFTSIFLDTMNDVDRDLFPVSSAMAMEMIDQIVALRAIATESGHLIQDVGGVMGVENAFKKRLKKILRLIRAKSGSFLESMTYPTLDQEEALEKLDEAIIESAKQAGLRAQVVGLNADQTLAVCSLVVKSELDFEKFLSRPLLEYFYLQILSKDAAMLESMNAFTSMAAWLAFKKEHCLQPQPLPWLMASDDMMHRSTIRCFLFGRKDPESLIRLLPRDVALLIVGWVTPFLIAGR